MGLCPSCGAELAENLVEAIKDPSQPDVKCPYPWRGITNRPVPHMTDEIAGRLLNAIFEGNPPPNFGVARGQLREVERYDDIFEDLDKLVFDDIRAEMKTIQLENVGKDFLETLIGVDVNNEGELEDGWY